MCPSKNPTANNDTGFFDEDYFMYGEDNDFFSRLSRSGYIILQTNIPVWHYGEGASKGKEFKTAWLIYRNSIRYSLKNEGLAGAVKMFLALLNEGCNPLIRHKRENQVVTRITRYNVAINLIFILASCAWNIINILPTMRSRNTDLQRINKVKSDMVREKTQNRGSY